ncbi:hypothetical protein B7495_04770 [Cryobacterium sp. LW097]|uniref:helix-turn-helix transcriptional regulator n=1 Tax=Cryobacterium sp. LW097 TaxID=1978566 RepID=UPI000B4C834B|nr:helix-turn-helix transcriptional regulator [Cryobacterium sp. LW097]ASD21487.1 hypothetical protein B7495_04770 [Cryobacterium sp. LW097]
MTMEQKQAAKDIVRDHSRWAAEHNLRAQEELLNLICVHQEQSGNSIDMVADRLGISAPEVEEILEGRADVTLTELRLLSVACDVVVAYSVRPAAKAHIKWLGWTTRRIQAHEHLPNHWGDATIAQTARLYAESVR